MPLLSETPTSPTPAASRIFDTAIPEAPAPQTTARIAGSSLPTTRAAPRSAASATIAVPCWSSCMTGMSSMARSRSSISKQRGAEMSSRLMPPKLGASAATTRTTSSTSVTSMQTGTALMPANFLNSSALPSMTGIAAAGPMSPRPRTAVPSLTTATVLPTQV